MSKGCEKEIKASATRKVRREGGNGAVPCLLKISIKWPRLMEEKGKEAQTRPGRETSKELFGAQREGKKER